MLLGPMGHIREFRRLYPLLFRERGPMAFAVPPRILGELHALARALERRLERDPGAGFWVRACVPTFNGLLVALGGRPPDDVRSLVLATRERTAKKKARADRRDGRPPCASEARRYSRSVETNASPDPRRFGPILPGV